MDAGFPKDHAQSKSYSAMAIQFNSIARAYLPT
jgi:hypothetical protein